MPSVTFNTYRKNLGKKTHHTQVRLRQKFCSHRHLPLRTQSKSTNTQERLKPAITKQTQMIAEMHIPKIFRQPIYKAYSKFYKVNLAEVELPLKDYPTFSAFFTRKITRPLPPPQPNTVSSPCDGKVLVFEEITGDKCEIIKGCKYSISELVSGTSRQ